MLDKHVTAVLDKIKFRATVGFNKYGTNMERKDLSEIDWLVHAQEEAMDLAIYLQRIIDDKLNELPK